MFDFNSRTRPVVKWAGGKSQVLAALLSLFPKRFERYIEPFLGGGAVFHCLRTGVSTIVGDANSDLIFVYESIRDCPKKLMTQLDQHARAYSEKHYYEVRSSQPMDKLERAARLIYLNKTCFNGLYRENSRGEFNVSFGMRKSCPELYDEFNLLTFSKKLQATKIHCGDFEETIGDAGRGDFVYCDPPYVPISKTASFASYHKLGFTLDDHRRLIRACEQAVSRGAHIAISNSYGSTVEELMKGWKIHLLEAKRAINCRGEKRGPITETLALLGPRQRTKSRPFPVSVCA